MPSTDLHQGVIEGRESLVRTINDGVLTPIPGEQPTGKNPRELKLWVDLKNARPKPIDPSIEYNNENAKRIRTEWAGYRNLVEDALCKCSKDIELGIFLIEASSRVHGFPGVRDGLWMLGGLITGFRNNGLHPLAVDGDLEIQYGKLDWLNDRFPDVICEIPLTWRPEPDVNYSLNYFKESRRQNGMITAAEFDAAAAAATKEQYIDLINSIDDAKAEFARFKQIANESYGSEVSSFINAEETLEECLAAAKTILRKRGPGSGAVDRAKPRDNSTEALPKEPLLGSNSTAPPGDAWSACEEMARGGNIDGALSAMTSLAAAEPNGRVRFQRKLLLADVCLQSNRKKLATSILQELNEIIELHKLESWETSEIVGGVWARLVRCYRDRAAGTADKDREAEFFQKLSRLDPWQALACGEPVKED